MEETTSPTIIFPPPEIKGIIDKTAEYVAQSGPILEQRVRETEKNNSKFSFLNPSDPYFAYYQNQLSDFKSGHTIQTKSDSDETLETSDSNPIIPIEPEPFQFSYPYSILSAHDLDIIKTTAQFVAKNGRAFMTSIIQREQRNSQFDFLKPSHRLFPYFINLTEQYSKILLPPPSLLERLNSNINNRASIMERINTRENYLKYYYAESEKQNLKHDKEKEEYYAIDWHSFVVVGTLEISDTDFSSELPPPLRLQDLYSMSLVDKSLNDIPKLQSSQSQNNVPANLSTSLIDDQESDVEMDEDDESEEDEDAAKAIVPKPDINDLPLKLPILDSSAPMKIKTNYTPKLLVNKISNDFWVCPVCNEKVSVSEIDEHIRIETLDPKRKEQLQSYERKIRESNLVSSGTDIAKYLKKISTNRSDIFGDQISSQQTPDDQHESEEKRVPIMWDGYTASAEETARRAAIGVSAEDQIAAIHRRKGLIADPNAEKIGPQLASPNILTQVQSNQNEPPYQIQNQLSFSNNHILTTPLQNSAPNTSDLFYNSHPQYQAQPPIQPLVPEQNLSFQNLQNPYHNQVSNPLYPNYPVYTENVQPTNSSDLSSHGISQIPIKRELEGQETQKNTTNFEDLESSKRSRIDSSENYSISDTAIQPSNSSQIIDPSTGLINMNHWIKLYPDEFDLSIKLSGIPSDLLNDPADLEKTHIIHVSPDMLVSSVKTLISETIGLPTGKQKLSVISMYTLQPPPEMFTNSIGMTLKNPLSIASYNLTKGAFLSLTLRERGGRK
ncbi:putative splicing factor 3A subunit 1 [Smittium mucronatum]|uniref:Putative splicing factor 3A subunit 1 n=1 Tax=Smittium mucronatum TaxID=133383 RepID=A0A1R0GZW1_9FUNG|nr:putative splicing factor 3A subunit 1 [Smittium mucronatum]